MSDLEVVMRELYLIKRDIDAYSLHSKTFSKYKNMFNGQNVVLVATGPTLKYFVPIQDAVYVGVNSAFLYDKIHLDFLFIQDYGTKSYLEKALEYKTKKFYGILNKKPEIIIPESVAIRHSAERYYTNYVKDPKINQDLDLVYDITTHPLTDYNSVVFSAIQFIAYANPKQLYLVGCDCNTAGQFNTKTPNHLNLNCVKNGWQKTKEFMSIYYPETKIVSINPVGLTGLFNDVYTIQR